MRIYVCCGYKECVYVCVYKYSYTYVDMGGTVAPVEP